MSFKNRGSYDPSQATLPVDRQVARKPKRPRRKRHPAPQWPPDITIYCDGGCFPNPGPGGWGFTCCETKLEACGGDRATTNNRMEITAALEAMRHHLAVNGAGKSLRIVSDSQYVVNACCSWIKKWKAKGWAKADGPLKNADLWLQIDAVISELKVRFEWVRGHNGNQFNERADELAEIGSLMMNM